MRIRTDEDTSRATLRIIAALALGVAVFSLATPAGAAAPTDHSVTNCNDSGSGSLRQAVKNISSGGTISFALVPPCERISLATTIGITRNLTIDGPGASALAVSGGGTVGVFHIHPGATVTLSGLTIEDGASPYGGGISNDGTLTVTGSTLSGNTATTGGGGIWNDGTLNVTDSTLSGNKSSYYGGGIYSSSSGTLTVADSTIADNSAIASFFNYPEYAYGGGIYAYGTATITTSTVSDNTTTALGGGGGGGGIFNGGTLNVTDSTLSGNLTTIVDGVTSTDGGGGIDNVGTLSVADSTLSTNGTNEVGGGIDNGWKLKIAQSTLSGNSAPTGGGIENGDGDVASATATIIANSASGDDCSGNVGDDGYNLDDDGSCGFAAVSDHPDTPAGLDPGGLLDNGGPTQTIALVSGSAADGAVNDASLCSTPDQRGVQRPTPCDIGSVQLVLTAQTITFTSTPPPDATVGGPNYSVSAAGGASGNPVTFSIDASASSVCAINGSTVTFLGAGTCVVDANQAGNSDYGSAAQVQQRFNVSPAARTITSPGAASATAGSPFSFLVTTTGAPVPSIASKGKLPRGLTVTDIDNGTATMGGTPEKPGVYHFTITATFGKDKGKDVVRQPFTLTVDAG